MVFGIIEILFIIVSIGLIAGGIVLYRKKTKLNSTKLMLLGIILLLIGRAFNAQGIEWLVFAAGLILGIVGFIRKDEMV